MSDPIPSQSPRNVFVSMLFALVVGNSAVIFFDLFADAPSFLLFPLLTWAFAFFIVISSWADWSLSFTEPYSNQLIQKIYSREFFLLLLDVAILYAYHFLFLVVSANTDFNWPDTINTYRALTVIFALYFIWDWMNYLVPKKLEPIWAIGPSGGLCIVSALICSVCYQLRGYEVGKWVLVVAYTISFVVIILFRKFHEARKLKLQKAKSALVPP